MMFFGAAKLRDTPVDVFPEFAPPRVEIQTPCLGLSADEVEEFVTVPLEEQLNGVPGLDVIRSTRSRSCRRSRSYSSAGPTCSRRAKSCRSDSPVWPTLPSWARPPVMMQPLSSTSRTLKIGLSSGRALADRAVVLARHKIRQRLLRVPGVANVAIWGQRKQQRQVLVDPERLRRTACRWPRSWR